LADELHAGHPERHGGAARAGRFWEEHYGRQERVWSGRPNPVLVDVIGGLRQGTALDLGCGEGGDAIWLARRGWRVTAVDLSATALDRASEDATAAGVADRIDFRQHDLALDFPSGAFDLVSAQYLHSPVAFPREEVLRAATRAVAPGGLLLVVGHAGFPPWAGHDHDVEVHFPTPREVLDGLDRYSRRHAVGQMATVAYADLDLRSGELRYACAGHPPPALVRAGGAPEILWDGRSLPLGACLHPRPREAATVTLAPGSIVVLYTDGLSERRDEALDASLDRLLTALGAVDLTSDVAEGILRSMLGRAPRTDDVCVLAANLVP